VLKLCPTCGGRASAEVGLPPTEGTRTWPAPSRPTWSPASIYARRTCRFRPRSPSWDERWSPRLSS